MGLVVSDRGGDRPNITPDAQIVTAVCVDVVDRGVHESEWNGKKKKQEKLSVHYLLDSYITEDLTDPTTGEPIEVPEKLVGMPFMLSRWFTQSLNERAALRAFLEKWRGKPFTKAELAGFDVESLIGVPCTLVVAHKARQDGTVRAIIDSIVPLKRGDKISAELVKHVDEYVRFVDRPDSDMDVRGGEAEKSSDSKDEEEDFEPPF